MNYDMSIVYFIVILSELAGPGLIKLTLPCSKPPTNYLVRIKTNDFVFKVNTKVTTPIV